MGEEEEIPNPMIDHLVADVQEEILLRLPLKSILKLKTVSKEWKSILEARRFAERRRMVGKKAQILAGRHSPRSPPFEGEEGVEMVYLHSVRMAAVRPSLTCDGLVCIPVPGWVNVWNPSTGERLRFPSGPGPVITDRYSLEICQGNSFWDLFPGLWAMGFGKDIVNGSYKVVRMSFDSNQSDILDVNIGEWRKLLNPPLYYVDDRQKSAYLNGSVYWLDAYYSYRILALDLHTEQFRDVPTPPTHGPGQIVTLEDRLTITTSDNGYLHWEVKIWTMDPQEETWSKTYFIRLFPRALYPHTWRLWCRPLAVSNKGNLFFHDNDHRLFKYYPETDQVHLVENSIRIVGTFVENTGPIRHLTTVSTYEYRSEFQHLDHVPDDLQCDPINFVAISNEGSSVNIPQKISKMFSRIKLRRVPNIFLTTTLVSLVVFRYYSGLSRA